MKKTFIIMITMFIVSTAGSLLISGCASLTPQLAASPECRHYAPYAADVFGDRNNVPVRIGIRKVGEKQIGGLTIPISHAWAEAHVSGGWLELGFLSDGTVGIDNAQSNRGNAERYFSVMEWHRFRSSLRMDDDKFPGHNDG